MFSADFYRILLDLLYQLYYYLWNENTLKDPETIDQEHAESGVCSVCSSNGACVGEGAAAAGEKVVVQIVVRLKDEFTRCAHGGQVQGVPGDLLCITLIIPFFS